MRSLNTRPAGDFPSCAKPATGIATLEDAARYIAALFSETRALPHWHRTIQTLRTATREPRYIVLATTNPETALTMGDLLEIKSPVGHCVCAAPTEHSHHHKLAERLAKELKLTDAQKTAYNDFVNARTKGVDDVKSMLCSTKPDLSTFESRLTFHQTVLEARLAALKEENPKLIAFYQSLDASQKEKFDNFRHDQDSH